MLLAKTARAGLLRHYAPRKDCKGWIVSERSSSQRLQKKVYVKQGRYFLSCLSTAKAASCSAFRRVVLLLSLDKPSDSMVQDT